MVAKFLGEFSKRLFFKKSYDVCEQPKISLFLFEYASMLLLSAFPLKETTCSKICSKSWPKSEKSSLPVGVRR